MSEHNEAIQKNKTTRQIKKNKKIDCHENPMDFLAMTKKCGLLLATNRPRNDDMCGFVCILQNIVRHCEIRRSRIVAINTSSVILSVANFRGNPNDSQNILRKY